MSRPRDTQPAAALALDLQKRRLTITEGGEAVGTFAVAQLRRAGTAYGRSWALVFQDAAMAIAATEMPAAAHRLAWWALAALHPREWSRVNASDIAAAFGWHRTTASRALGDLVAAGIIERKAGDDRAMRLALALAWQGTVGAYHKERRARPTRLALALPPDLSPIWRAADHCEGAAERGAGAGRRAGTRAKP